MRVLTGLLLLALVAGCAGPRVPQPEAPPMRIPNDGRIEPGRRTPTDEDATRRWLEQQTVDERVAGDGFVDSRSRVRGRTPTDEAATRDWLEREKERRSYVPPSPPPTRIVERIVIETPNAYGYGAYQDPGRASSFPYYTAYGAGLGAAIGSTSCNAGEGAAIGAGVGLFVDLVSWR